MAALAYREPRPMNSGAKVAIRNLPPFSPVAVKVMLLLRQQDVSYRQVCDVLMVDAAFSAEVLRLANSAATGCRFPTASILQALTVLGIPRVSALTVSLALSKFLKPVSKLPVLHRCWRHNLATAVSAGELADRYNLEPDLGYTFGLLHDIGRLGLLVAFPREYSRLVEIADQESRGLVNLELSTFGFDHREVGAWLTAQWNLPADLADVSLQHGPGATPGSALSRLVDEACSMANRNGFSVASSTGIPTIDQDLPKLDQSIIERVNLLEQEYGF